jgi:hypothetical protein
MDKHRGLTAHPLNYSSLLVPPPLRSLEMSLPARFDSMLPQERSWRSDVPAVHRHVPHWSPDWSRGIGNVMTSWYDYPLCYFSLDACWKHHAPYFVPNVFGRESKTLLLSSASRNNKTETLSSPSKETRILALGGNDPKTNAKLPLKKRDIAL